MSDTSRKESQAFISFFSTYELSHAVKDVSDLCDGAVLAEVLALADQQYFLQTVRTDPDGSWVDRFTALKRLYRLMTKYFVDVLEKPTIRFDVPDLQAVAKTQDLQSTLILCRLTIAIGVQCQNNKDFIERIQSLNETDQHYLMKAIEQVISKTGDDGMTEDDQWYQLQSERSQIQSQKDTIEKAYNDLVTEHKALQATLEEAVTEREEALANLRENRNDSDLRRSDKSDTAYRGEIDRLRAELQKSEDNLAITEADLDKSSSQVAELNRRVEDLQAKADEAAILKDRVDELRHAADKLQKTENVNEKYKKKLQEFADLRSHVKSLEKQNADLVDKNASLEEDYKKVSSFKPLMESYKGQIADLEVKASSRAKENETLTYELDQTKLRLKITTEERAKDSEALELYQERVRELELSRPLTKAEVAANGATGVDATDLDGEAEALGEELDSALAGTTMTDLKLQVRKLKRELDSVRKNEADASRILVLENLLEDANRMKTRYEADYLAAHRAQLVLQSNLEEIRSGKSLGDGAEAAIALRLRLNQTTDELDALRKAHTELEVKAESEHKELITARSDLNLVNKDQLDILATLRDSVNEDKVEMEAEVERLLGQIKELKEKNNMQLEQVNSLLLDKVNMQSEGIGQREAALKRERDYGDLRKTLSGKEIPEDIKANLLSLHEENVILKEQSKTTQDKLTKARAFIKSQDKLFKEEQVKANASKPGTSAEAEELYRTQITALEDEVARLKAKETRLMTVYRKEQELLLSKVHSYGASTVRSQLGAVGSAASGNKPNSWLGQQRIQIGQGLQR